MEQTNNQILKLVLNYCSDNMADTPEEMLYGLVKLSSLSDMALRYLLKDKGIEDSEEVRNGIEEIRRVIRERNLDPELIKDSLWQMLPLIEQDDRSTGEFKKVISAYDEKTPVSSMMQDVFSAIEPEELKVFSVGKDLKDVNEYKNILNEKLSSSHPARKEKIAAGPDESDKAETVKETVKKEEKKTDQAEAETEAVEIFSERLRTYLETLEKVIPELVKTDNQELLWRQSLLISIDEGLGFSTFTKQIEDIFKKNDLTGANYGKSIITEMKFIYTGKEAEHYFDNPIGEIEEKVAKFGDIDDRKKVYSILAIDLSQVCGRLNDPRFREFLRAVERNCDSAFVIFRVPYLERGALADVEAVITDVMAAETIIVPPVSISDMLDYMCKRAKKYGYSFEKGCSELLEQAVINEKNDGRFYGYRTLNKIVDTLIYRIIRDSAVIKKTGKKITVKQLKDHADTTARIVDPDRMTDGLTGVDEIIDRIDRAINQVKVSKQLYEKGNEVERPSIHMMFRGNPGTGKTTIARIVAARMKAAGILEKGNFFEIKGRDLCAEYVGQTTPRTTRICRDAYGSVLFIDEAYELYRGKESGEKDFGPEALAALVAEMENHRDDMCVIFAGYTDEMNTMVTGNPGLKSRIPIVIDFPNYTREQLEDIFFKMMEGKFDYEPAVRKCAHDFFASISDDVLSAKEFSNARFVRNLFESVWGEAALRFDLDGDNKLIIKESDFNAAVEKVDLKTISEKKPNRIGFAV